MVFHHPGIKYELLNGIIYIKEVVYWNLILEHNLEQGIYVKTGALAVFELNIWK